MKERYPNFDLLRLLLATEVVFSHGWALTDPAFTWPGLILAVPAFLAISGFLVLQSYTSSRSWGHFLKKRALRIFPALVLSMLLCTLLLGPAATWNSVLTWISGGLIEVKGAFNWPVWSLAWEELAYLILALLWMAGAYKRPIVIWALLVASIGLVFVGRSLPPQLQVVTMLPPAFFIGNLMYLYRDRACKVHPLLPWVVLLLVLFYRDIPGMRAVVGVLPAAFQAFAVVWVGIAGARAIPARFPDVSYGIYIYHLPIAMFLVNQKLAATPDQMALLLPLPLLAVAISSWYLAEKPALRRKNIGSANGPGSDESVGGYRAA